ncbi:MAG: hypothetical protein HZC10_06065 [Nitrospirae bacterium]|nr:hypothetical protein [Nitrospirota bacterium]
MLDSVLLWKKVIKKTPPLLPLDYSKAPFEIIRMIIEDKSAAPIILDGIAKAYYNSSKVIEVVLRNPNILPQTIRFLLANSSREIQQLVISIKEKGLTPYAAQKDLAALETEAEAEGVDERSEKYLNIFQQIQQMSVSEKIQLALKGNKEARNILIKDANKKVALTVLESPKMTEQEIEMIAQSKNVSEDVLREIASKRDWLKNYVVVRSLVNNPKTPVGISLSHLNRLKEKDLADLSKNKNIPEALRSAANRLVILRKKSANSK